MAQLVHRAHDLIQTQDRVRGLLAANRSIVGELAVAKVLPRIVDAARATAGARYAALGVLAGDGTFASLVHSGLRPAEAAGIEDFPVGRGVQSVMAGTRQPVRIDDLTAHPASVGVPVSHPAMTAFLGVSIYVDEIEFGHLFLTEPTAGGSFSEQDEELIGALAETAGIAIENAQLYEESRRRQAWLLASAELSHRLLGTARQSDEDAVWRLIVGSVRRLANAEMVALVTPAGDGSELQIKVAAGTDQGILEGASYPAAGSVAWAVMQGGRRVVMADGAEHQLRQPTRPTEFAGPSMVLPLQGKGSALGVLVISRDPSAPAFAAADVDMAEDFARQAAVAVELAEARAAHQRLGALEDRERIARDLHDHVIQRLFATGLTLQAQAGAVGNPVVRERLGRTVEDLDETIRQIRTSIFALKYSQPTVSSIRATVLTLVDDLAPTLGFRPSTHLLGPLDTLSSDDLVADLAAVVGEALTNVARHANATSARVAVEATGERLTVTVLDDGRGIRHNVRLRGLTNLRERAEARGGSLVIDPAPGGGSRLTWSIPLS